MARRTGPNRKKHNPYAEFESTKYPPYGRLPVEMMLRHPDMGPVPEGLSEPEKVDRIFKFFGPSQKVAYFYRHRERPWSTRPNPGRPVYMAQLQEAWEREGLLYRDISPKTESLEGEYYLRYRVEVYDRADGSTKILVMSLDALKEKLSKEPLRAR